MNYFLLQFNANIKQFSKQSQIAKFWNAKQRYKSVLRGK